VSAAALAERVRAAPARCGAVRVVAVDGRSGAGKSTFARALAAALDDAPVLPLEGIYPGWEGLERGIAIVAGDVLPALAEGRTALVPQWDWAAGAWGAPRAFAPAPVVVLEGVGAGAARVAPYLSLLVWLELDDAERRQRALARDGETYRPFWDTWAAQETALIAREEIAARADVVLELAQT
jgi:uridine kinase